MSLDQTGGKARSGSVLHTSRVAYVTDRTGKQKAEVSKMTFSSCLGKFAVMPTESLADTLKLEAQQVLDELDRRHLIPFKLTAFKVEWIGLDKYKIYFHDSRLPALMISWVEGHSFRDLFRSAILDRVSGTN